MSSKWILPNPITCYDDYKDLVLMREWPITYDYSNNRGPKSRVLIENNKYNMAIPYYEGECIRKSLCSQFLRYSKTLEKKGTVMRTVIKDILGKDTYCEKIEYIELTYYGYIDMDVAVRYKGFKPFRIDILKIHDYNHENEVEHMKMRTYRPVLKFDS